MDAVLGGSDQRKIFDFAEKILPQLGKEKRVHLVNPLLDGLMGGGSKMSASDEMSKIDVLDPREEVKRRLKKAFCEPGNIQGNGVLALVRDLLLPIYGKFRLERKEQNGGPADYESYEKLENDFKDQVCVKL